MKNKYPFLVLLLVFLWEVGASQSAICGYKFRKRITFNPAQVAGSTDLVDFPALIDITADTDLETTANGGDVTSNSGFDIVFTSADGVTLLNFDLEDYVATTGKYTAWVTIPLLSTSVNTYIYMYYGNTGITTNQSSTATWADYYGVWHLENGSFADRSPNGYNGTNQGTTNQAPAKINDGRANSGTQWIDVSSSFPNLTSNFTISGWAYTTLNTKQGQRIFCDDQNNSGGYALSIGDGGTGMLRFFARGSSVVILDSPLNAIANNTWYYCVGVADITNGTKTIYINGVQVGTQAATGFGTDAGPATISGENASGETGNRLQGRIDEVRVANSALTAGWIETEYNNQNSPSTFYSIGTEPIVWDGSTSTAWNTGTNWSTNAVPGAGADVIIANVANQPILNVSPSLSSLWLQTSTNFSLSTRTISIAYDITNCGNIVPNTGIVQMNGTSSSIQEQFVSGSGTYALSNFIVNNTFAPSPSVTLNSPVSVSNSLILSSGILKTTATNIISLGNSAFSSPGANGVFVSGPISKSGTAAFVYPVGKGTKWRRVQTSGYSATATFRVEYFNSAYTNTSSVTSPITDVSVVEYWQIDRIAGAGNALVSLYWEDATVSGIDNCADLEIVRFNGTNWVKIAATTNGGSTCSGTGTGIITSDAVVTSFSPFTFGSQSTGVNPLPITLAEFNALCDGTRVVVNWVTASEKNNDHFILESSTDGLVWKDLAHIEGSHNSVNKKEYSFVDDSRPVVGRYYRLSQVDEDGTQSKYWNIEVTCGSEQNSMRIFPNPATKDVNIEFKVSGGYAAGTLEILDNMGRTCFSNELVLDKTNTIVQLPGDFKPGTYMVVFHSNTVTMPVRKLVILN